MGDVVYLTGLTRLPIPVERVCDGAKDLSSVFILGYDKDGVFTCATSMGANAFPLMLQMAQRFIHKYLSGDYDE